MDGQQIIDFLKQPSRYPRNLIRGDVDEPVAWGDLVWICEKVSRVVDRVGIKEFAIRSENWSGLIVVYGMDEPAPRRRLRETLEADGFTVTVRRNTYGTSLEVHPRNADLIMTRYDLIMNTIADAIVQASDASRGRTTPGHPGVDRATAHRNQGLQHLPEGTSQWPALRIEGA